MISYSVIRSINSDVRWQSTFRTLYDMYESYQHRPHIRRSRLLHRHVDEERRFFPPCMFHLLNVLRENHRLAHIWRYNFSLFLKDIGLTLEESTEFWKNEYSQCCSAGSSCTHSWQQNERKYRYSIRHLYGLEGAKIEKSCKSCKHIQVIEPTNTRLVISVFCLLIFRSLLDQTFQTMQIGMRDEGGCPFVHFDNSNFLATLRDTVKQNKSVVDEITDLKNSGKPCEACALHMKVSSGFAPDDCRVSGENVPFESPVTYYFCTKSYANKSLDW